MPHSPDGDRRYHGPARSAERSPCADRCDHCGAPWVCRKLLLKIDVDETNIDRLESLSCDEIFAERERDYRESYRAIPPLDKLCERYGDAENRRIYIMSRDVEERWLDMHRRAIGTAPPID